MTQKKAPDTENLKKSIDNFAKNTLKDKIGGNLRQIYNDVVNEPIPDDFLTLLAQADEIDTDAN